MLLETHVHTAETSRCARMPAKDIVRGYIAAGFDAITLTDHYLAGDYDYYRSKSIANAFLRGYHAAQEAAEGTGLRVLLGMEFRLMDDFNDILIYGLTEDTIYAMEGYPPKTYPELRAWADENQLYICQAHPFRSGCRPVDPAILDGVEIYNGSPDTPNHNEKALAYAQKHNLRMQAGSDCHFAEGLGVCGLQVPGGIHTSPELADFLLHNQPKFWHESTNADGLDAFNW